MTSLYKTVKPAAKERSFVDDQRPVVKDSRKSHRLPVQKMRAFNFLGVQDGLQLTDLPRPNPSQTQVLIKVKAAGICHSDCFIVKDENYSLIGKRPIVLGHEVAGTIVEIGNAVEGYQIGDAIACCLQSHPMATQSWSNAIGIGYDGGYAEYAIIDQDNIIRIPPQLSFAQAAVATDSVSTAYHAVISEGCVDPSKTVAVVGLGGLGLAGVQIASLKGATVYGIDIDAGKFELAKESGATDCARTLDELSHVSFDVIFDFAGADITTANAAKSVKSGGKVILVGLASTQTTLNTHDLVTRSIIVQGSVGASKSEFKEVLDLVAQGKISSLLKEVAFIDVPREIEGLSVGGVIGRMFTDPSKATADIE